MHTDPIVDEIHGIRREHAEKFNYNLLEIFDDLKKQEKRSGRKFISLPIRRGKQSEIEDEDVANVEVMKKKYSKSQEIKC